VERELLKLEGVVMDSRVRVAINGCGRIGRQLIPLFTEDERFELVAINGASEATRLQLKGLLEFDSVYGWSGVDVGVDEWELSYSGHNIKLLNERGPLAALPWGYLDVDLVIEATGKHVGDIREHTIAGAKKVILSAPAKKPEEDIDATIVLGANEYVYDPKRHHVVSNASCTTNAAAPIFRVLIDEYGVKGGNLTTTHAYTTSQNLLDNRGKDTARARSVSENIIYTDTGVTKALKLVCPAVGDVTAAALRVNSPAGSILRFDPIVLDTPNPPSVEEFNAVLWEAAHSEHQGLIACWDESRGYSFTANMVVGNPASVVVDLTKTYYSTAVGGFYLTTYYDNEAGYSKRLKDLADLMMLG
jgi:glyceraldehyde 3-phosphate dehydrogenase